VDYRETKKHRLVTLINDKKERVGIKFKKDDPDPTLMRFVSVDPHPGDQDDPQSLNEYVYCKNNPINYTDPDGDFIETGLDIASVVYSANEFRKNRSWGNAGWLAFDTLMVALPLGTGSGSIRAGLKAGKGVKVGEKIGGYKVTGECVRRMGDRNITKAEILTTIKEGKSFRYIHKGTEAIGYYTKKTGVFVGTKEKHITTVIKGRSKRMIKYIMKKGWKGK